MERLKLLTNKKILANDLGMSMSTFQRWLKRNNIDVPRGLITPALQQKIWNIFNGNLNILNEADLNSEKTKQVDTK
jgi:hypothetical protein